MEKKELNLLFMGTPEISAYVFEQMILDGYHFVGLVAQPDHPVGRKGIIEKVPTKKILRKNDLLFAITGESIADIGKCTAYLGEEEGFVGGDILVVRHGQNPKYLSYVLSTSDAISQKGRGMVKNKVVHASAASIGAIEIPLPPLEVQREIVRILDNYTELETELAAKLTAELTARKKQYEFYRDKLLSFGETKK